MVLSIITHNITQQTYAKLGEIILRWAEADGFLGNSINWMSGFAPESTEATRVYKLSMGEKIKSLERCRTRLPSAAANDVATLLQDIQQATKKWKKDERDVIAHGTALKTKDDAIVLRTDKGYEFRIDDVDDALTHARYISDLAVRLNLSLAAPWTKKLFSPLGRSD